MVNTILLYFITYYKAKTVLLRYKTGWIGVQGGRGEHESLEFSSIVRAFRVRVRARVYKQNTHALWFKHTDTDTDTHTHVIPHVRLLCCSLDRWMV
mgnify:CR=1 FL=1